MMGSFVIHAQPLFYVIESSNWFKRAASSADLWTEEDKDDRRSTTPYNQMADPDNLSWCYLFIVYIERFALVYSITVIANFMPGLNLMLVFIGAMFGTLIVYVIPLLFYLKAYEVKEGETDPRSKIKCFGWIFVTSGVLLGLYSLVFFIWAIATGVEL